MLVSFYLVVLLTFGVYVFYVFFHVWVVFKLFYKDGRLRVVVSTANFMGFDWDLIENVC